MSQFNTIHKIFLVKMLLKSTQQFSSFPYIKLILCVDEKMKPFIKPEDEESTAFSPQTKTATENFDYFLLRKMTR